MKLKDLKNKEIHLVGLSGAEISSLALFLISLGCRKLVGHDFKNNKQLKQSFFSYHDNLTLIAKEKLFKKLTRGLFKLQLGSTYLKNLTTADWFFLTSSWFRYLENKKLFKTVKQNKNKVWNWYNFLLQFFPGLVVGVTGTAGKGTVVNLAHKILTAAGLNCFLMGESWHFTDWQKILAAGKKAIVLAEVNNRSLTFADHLKKSPQIAVITNIFPHHLDDHQQSFKKYREVKLNIFKNQKKTDRLIVNGDDPVLKKIAWPTKTLFYSLNGPGQLLIGNPYFNSSHLKSDALAAIKIAEIFKVKERFIKEAIKKILPRAARMEVVKKIKGITFVDDGAATRPQATALAVANLPKNKVILILEGSRKYRLTKEYQKLIAVLKKQKIKKIFLSGTISNYLYPLLVAASLPVFKTADFKSSVFGAYRSAVSGEIVLLSPACESFGAFADYRQRSAQFKKIIKSL